VLGISEKDRRDLFLCSMLHDNGLTIAAVNAGESRFELLKGHCIAGEVNAARFPVAEKRENVIKYHHENYDGTGIFEMSGEEIPLFSQIIRVSDYVESRLNSLNPDAGSVETIRGNVVKYVDTLFSPAVVDAFMDASGNDRFWYDLQFCGVDWVLSRRFPQITYDCSWRDVVAVSKVFAKIIDSKSSFTSNHTKGVTDKIDVMTEHYGFNQLSCAKLHVAANLHDIGKLYIPATILNKPYKLDMPDFREVRKHAYFTKVILERVPGFEDISRWAANHHEKLNGDGYPEGLKGEELDFESRLLCVVDIYQALIENRPYRKGMSHSKACKVLDYMVRNKQIDIQIVDDVKRAFRL